jgi:pentatricopeptide repeat protein
MDAAGKMGRWDVAQRVFALAKAANIRLDAVSFSTMMNAAGVVGQWQHAESLLEEMRVRRR